METVSPKIDWEAIRKSSTFISITSTISVIITVVITILVYRCFCNTSRKYVLPLVTHFFNKRKEAENQPHSIEENDPMQPQQKVEPEMRRKINAKTMKVSFMNDDNDVESAL